MRRIAIYTALVLFFGCSPKTETPPDITANQVVPSETQLAYQQQEFVGFIHFTVNTFTDKEWGYGDESPKIFNPTELNAEQWVTTAKAAGMQELILTAKHHDGFCLWPSQYTEHSVKNSPYKNGKGDIVKEMVDACRKHGLKVGLYLSPWDRNHADYGKPEYITYYRNQLRELLTNYGEINEIWFDGANGGDGYYGGANEVRQIDRTTYYDWPTTFALVKELQPNIKIFSDAGPDIHWIGNEHGFAGEEFWSTIKADSLVIGASKSSYLNSGDPNGPDWIIGQCDVSIRPGWFYHSSQDSLVKTPQDLVDIYYKSVGRNAVLLINLPPDKRGLIHENDIDSLKAFREILDETFAENLAAGATASAKNYRLGHEKFSPDNVLDGLDSTYWATDDEVLPAELTLHLPEPQTFDRILIQEPIQLGQRISKFRLEAKVGDNWKTLYEGTTIGYKRLIRTEPVQSDQVKLVVWDANNTVSISNMAIFKASSRE